MIFCCTGRSKSPSPARGGGDKRIDSPTPGTDPDGGKPNTVNGIMGSPGTQRIKVSKRYFCNILS